MATAAQLSQAETAYLNNADYAESRSVPRARAFVTACRKLLVLLPSSMTKGSNSVSQRVDLIANELKDAQAWLERFSSDDIPGPIVTRTSFQGFRRFGG